MKLEFTRDRETKNTVRYAEVSDDGVQVVGTVYIQKTFAAAIGDPARITVEILPAE